MRDVILSAASMLWICHSERNLRGMGRCHSERSGETFYLSGIIAYRTLEYGVGYFFSVIV